MTAKIKPLNLCSQSPLSNEKVPALQKIFHLFRKNLIDYLDILYPDAASVTLLSFEQTRGSYHLASLEKTSFCSILAPYPFSGQTLVAMDPILVYPLINKMLGGDGNILPIAKPLNNLETALYKKLISNIVEGFASAWKDLAQISFIPQETALQDDQVFAIARFLIECNKIKGSLSIAITGDLLNLVPETTPTETSLPDLENSADWDTIPIDLTAILGKQFLSATDLKKLQPGDILLLDQPADEPILVKAGSEPLFKAKAGLTGINKGIAIRYPRNPETKSSTNKKKTKKS